MSDEGRSADGDLELTVVIPCLNESETLAGCIRRALGALRDHGIRGEVVVSDNGSTDGSQELARREGARVVDCPVRGYGAALQWGFAAARGRFVIMGDADQSYDFGLAPRFLEKAREGYDIVMGSRLRGTIEPGAMPALHRYLGTPVLTFVLNRFFGTGISDCNCGMRCIRRAIFDELEIVSPGMEFASEMIVKAAVHGARIAEIPIDFYRDRRSRRPHLRRWRDGWRHLRLLAWHAPDHTMSLPGLAMLAAGLPLALSQIGGPFWLGPAFFDIHYMILGITLSLVGTSALLMGIVVGVAMPPGRVRHVPLFARVHRWFTFDRAALVAALLLLAGLALDGFVLAFWLATRRGPLTPEFTRLTLFGMLLLALGAQLGLSALLLGTTGSAVLTAGVRDLVGSAPRPGGRRRTDPK